MITSSMPPFCKNQTALIIGLALLLCPAAEPAQNHSPTVLATVNGDDITTEQLLVELGRIHSGQQAESRTHFDLEKLVTKLINDLLLIQDARLQGLDQEPDIQRQVSAYALGLAVDEFIAQSIPDSFPISDQEVRDYFTDQFRQVHIFLLPLRERRQADSLLATLQRGSLLSELAPHFAAELYRFGGGDQGFKILRDLDSNVRDLIKSMTVGDVRGPVAYRSAFALIQLLAQKPADTAYFEMHASRIRAALNQEKKRSFREALTDSLKQKYPVTINDSLFQAILAAPDSAAKTPADSSQVVAHVGPDSVLLSALKRKLRLSAVGGSPDMKRSLAYQSLNDLIEARLFRLETQNRRFQDDSLIVEKAEVFEDSLLLLAYLTQVVSPKIIISPSQVDSVYQADREKYRAADRVKISQITVAGSDSAQQILQRLQDGADFSWMAESFSIDDYAQKGGDQGWSSLDIWPPLIRADLNGAAVNALLGPYIADDGYLILRIVDRRQGEIQDLATVKGMIQQQLSQVEFNRALDRVLTQLKENAQIEIHQEALKNLVLGGKAVE